MFIYLLKVNDNTRVGSCLVPAGLDALLKLGRRKNCQEYNMLYNKQSAHGAK